MSGLIKRQVEVSRGAYTEEEIADFYELGKLWLESGYHRKAESIMSGLNEVAPQFAPAWLGTTVIRALEKDFDGAMRAAKQALRVDPENLEALLYMATLALTLRDYTTAGTFLGEVSDGIEQGRAKSPHVARFFKMQLARYQNRG